MARIRGSRPRRPAVFDEQGWAMVTVVGIMVVIFLMLTATLTILDYETRQTSLNVNHAERVQIADGGLNAYLYEVRQNANYVTTNPHMGPVAFGQGTYEVQATPASGTVPITIVSTAKLSGSPVATRVSATVRFPTFSDYMFLCNGSIDIGADATIYGKIRANGDINNDGTCQDTVMASGRITGSGRFNGNPAQQAGQPTVNFGQVTGDLASIKSKAQANGTFLPANSNAGYYVHLEGASIRVTRVLSQNQTTGLLSLATTSAVYTIPGNGAIYFDDDIWVDGSYSQSLTIGVGSPSGSTGTVYIKDNLTNSGTASTTMGIIAKVSVEVQYWVSTFPNDATIQAALLAQTGHIEADWHNTGILRHSLTLRGSNAYAVQSGFVMVSGGRDIEGFDNRYYIYDNNLDMFPPPGYPVLAGGNMGVSSWRELQ